MSLAKALIVSGDPHVFIEAQFNPRELTQSYTGHIQPKAGGNPEILEWTAPTESEFKLTLFFDGLETKTDVRETYVKRLAALLDTGLKPPKLVRFVWGHVLFLGAIVSLEVKYTMFLPNGNPCRAEVNMSMRRGHCLEPPIHGKKGHSHEDTGEEWPPRRRTSRF